MSDETPPPPLRLKPRVRPATEGGAAESAPVPPPAPAEPAAPAAAADSGISKLRLKPKLAAEPAPAEAAPIPPSPAPPGPEAPPAAAVAERPRLKPRLSVEPPAQSAAEPAVAAPVPAPVEPPPAPVETPVAPPPPVAAPAVEAPAGEGAKFKLKPKAPEGETPAAAPAATPPAGSGVPKGIKILPPVVHIRAPENLEEEKAAEKIIITPKRRKRTKLWLGLAAALVILGGGGFYAWQAFMVEPPPPPPAPVAKVAPKPVAAAQPPAAPAAPTPSETLNQIAAAPAAMINKAKNVIEERRQLEQSRVDAMGTGEETTGQRAIATPLPGQLGGTPAKPAAPEAATVTRAQSELAPGISATTIDVIASADASAAFRVFVGSMKIGGVFQGAAPRAFINGRTVRIGETVDIPLGIVFDSLEPEKKLIVFRDRSGARVSRRY